MRCSASEGPVSCVHVAPPLCPLMLLKAWAPGRGGSRPPKEAASSAAVGTTVWERPCHGSPRLHSPSRNASASWGCTPRSAASVSAADNGPWALRAASATMVRTRRSSFTALPAPPDPAALAARDASPKGYPSATMRSSSWNSPRPLPRTDTWDITLWAGDRAAASPPPFRSCSRRSCRCTRPQMSRTSGPSASCPRSPSTALFSCLARLGTLVVCSSSSAVVSRAPSSAASVASEWVCARLRSPARRSTHRMTVCSWMRRRRGTSRLAACFASAGG
mmetsp:Transcript_37108/g.104735  ORF Transcript_37108/g.104735 Transcript_37108/m.104735 type:complete len:277 (-) Transcript_37108:1394-2224(-)